MSKIMDIIAYNVKRLRKDKGLTQKELGEMSGTSEPLIKRIEKGIANPTLDKMCKIADSLDVDVCDLVVMR